MSRRRLLIPPLSILLFLAFVLVGTYYVRKNLLEQAMTQAIGIGDQKTIRSLLDSWSCPANAKGTALFWAADQGNDEIARLCLERGAHPNTGKDTTPLSISICHQHMAIAKMCLDHGASVNPRGWWYEGNPLYAAVWRENREMVELLLARGADVNSTVGTGASVLVNEKMPQVGMYGGAITTGSHRTPVHEAAGGDPATGILELLLSHGADPNIHDNRGQTPLHVAVAGGKAANVAMLISHGADPDAVEEKGWTPLHLAVREPDLAVVSLLIEKGASVNLKNRRGMTPLALARAIKANILADPDHEAAEKESYAATWDPTIEILVMHGAKE